IALHKSIGVARKDGVVVTAGTPVAGVRLTAGSGALDVSTAPGATVSAHPAGAGPDVALTRSAGAAGHATFADLGAGHYTVTSKLAGKAPRQDEVAVAAGPATPLDAPLAAGATVSGTVRGAGGAPLPGAVVWAIDAASGTTSAARADDSGTYTIDTLTPGATDLWFTAHGYAPRHVSGGVGDATLDTAGTTVAFTAQAGAPARPVGGTRITVSDPGGRVPLRSTLTAADGTATVGPLAAGDYTVQAEAPGGATLSRALHVDAGARQARSAVGARVQSDEELLDLHPAPNLHFPPPGSRDGQFDYRLTQPDFLTGIHPPQRFGPDSDPAWSHGWADVHFTQPCPSAFRLKQLAAQSDLNVGTAFDAWNAAYLALLELNQANVNVALATSGAIANKIAGLSAAIAALAGPASITLSGEALFQFQAIASLASTFAGNYYSNKGDPSFNANQLTFQGLGALSHLVDNQLILIGRGSPLFSAFFGVADIINDIQQAQKDLEDANGRDTLAVIAGYEAAENNYLATVVRHDRLTKLLAKTAANCPDPDDDGQPPPSASVDLSVSNVAPNDPNAIDGPAGVGDPRWIPRGADLGYTVRFENIGPGTVNPPPGSTPASAPAVLVTVTETLDDAIDLDTFALGSIGWGAVDVPVPAGLQAFHGEVALADGTSVHVDAALDRATRTVTWTLATIDPVTGELATDPAAGFLPPESGTGDGQGHLAYTARLKPGVAHAATVSAQASIVFDRNAAIDTPAWTNTVDGQPPHSTVTAAAPPSGACKAQLAVTWSGDDTGSGLGGYTILVSENGGALEPWLAQTTATGATFDATPGTVYRFASVARDNAGNEEAVPDAPDATASTVACDGTAPTVTAAADPPGTDWRHTDATVTLAGTDAPGGSGVDKLTYTLSGAQTADATVSDNDATVAITAEGETTMTYGARDVAGNAAAQGSLKVRIDRTGPVVDITSPADGATVVQGAALTAGFTCTDPLSGVKSCDGSVVTGASLPTDTPGSHDLSVTAKDAAGNVTTVKRTYTVTSPAATVTPTPAVSTATPTPAVPTATPTPHAPATGFGTKLRVTVRPGKVAKHAKRAPFLIANPYGFAVTGRIRLLTTRQGRPVTKWRTFSVGAGKTGRRAISLPGSVRRRLEAGHRVKLRIAVQLKNAAGESRSLTHTVRLRR
ncbi:MAG: hypothetical protein QOF76_3608, partial [Solirubrobacteraceae bacterium]|nr:hypothetical protein [Solirubrobacteraceae bacterium]